MEFSIIIPVLNGGELLKKCIESVLAQEYKNYNIFLLDSGSKDGTIEWVTSLNNENITIIQSDKSLTIAENWARIKDLNKNEFMTILSHDDLVYKNYLSAMVELINKYPDASLYQSRFDFIDNQGNLIRKSRVLNSKVTVEDYLTLYFQNQFDSSATGYIMRSKDYDQLGGIPDYPGLLYADHELWIRLTNISYLAYTSQVLFAYRIHYSISKFSDAYVFKDTFLRFTKFIKDLSEQNPKVMEVYNRYFTEFIHQHCKSITIRFLRLGETKNNNSYIKFINEFKHIDSRYNPYFSPHILVSILLNSNTLTRNIYKYYHRLKYQKLYN